jgi:hypothetical protein
MWPIAGKMELAIRRGRRAAGPGWKVACHTWQAAFRIWPGHGSRATRRGPPGDRGMVEEARQNGPISHVAFRMWHVACHKPPGVCGRHMPRTASRVSLAPRGGGTRGASRLSADDGRRRLPILPESSTCPLVHSRPAGAQHLCRHDGGSRIVLGPLFIGTALANHKLAAVDVDFKSDCRRGVKGLELDGLESGAHATGDLDSPLIEDPPGKNENRHPNIENCRPVVATRDRLRTSGGLSGVVVLADGNTALAHMLHPTPAQLGRSSPRDPKPALGAIRGRDHGP